MVIFRVAGTYFRWDILLGLVVEMKFNSKLIVCILPLLNPNFAFSGQISVINPSASSSLIATGSSVSPAPVANTSTNSSVNSTIKSGIQVYGVGPHALSKIDKIAKIILISENDDIDRNIKLLEDEITYLMRHEGLSLVDRAKFELLLSKLRQGLN